MARLRAVLFLALAGSLVYLFWLPDVRPLRASNPRETAYTRLRQRQARQAGKRLEIQLHWVDWDGISPHLKDAVLIAEDDTFYRHGGVDWDGVREALRRDWAEKRLAYGGSTITQQVARNLYLSPSKNPLRKLKELLIARRLEKALGKRRIFELYLNIAEWGKGLFGCEAAAQAYFGKACAELDFDESVAMAVVLPNPRRYHPSKKGPYVERNMRRVIERMRASGLTPEAAPVEDFDLLFSTEPADSAALQSDEASESAGE